MVWSRDHSGTLSSLEYVLRSGENRANVTVVIINTIAQSLRLLGFGDQVASVEQLEVTKSNSQ